MLKEELIDALSGISFRATPTVVTMDMGLQFDFMSSYGAGSVFGTIGEWPAYKLAPIAGIKLKALKAKIEDKTIQEEDFDDTEIRYLISALHNVYATMYDEYYKNIYETFADLINLPDNYTGNIYCLLDVREWGDKPKFYTNDDDLISEFEESYTYDPTPWENMDEEDLQCWYDRLEDDMAEFPFVTFDEEVEE